MKTVLITGCSSGFGLETAAYFLAQGWRVVATMRDPQPGLLPASDHLVLLPLDVTDAASIASVIAAAGPIDVLVNNAGIGLLSIVEDTEIATMREIFDTNTIGLMAMVKAVVPQMRARKAGVIINVTSTVTVKPLPMLAVYTASKAAVEAFSTSLALELAPFDVAVRIVLPGQGKTKLGENARARMKMDFPPAYQAFAQEVFARTMAGSGGTLLEDVAQGVWRAATDPDCPMFLPAGSDAVAHFAEAGR
ncbi:short-chain dehydrogenase/reductase [Cypionkella aquatica]|uniref:Short-chain dehydrogenase/reductase n=1 Tax=Cypionkella aquatica TaxID=1756042 RepID=A0AA37TVP5_9RHOB|nr:SDR family oxidoreductase [Cypionkella aquatica]GLS85542.1 short-chain dehydrogenase/reductase [Cypionkella aquatica]